MSISETAFPKIKPLTAANYQTWKGDVEYVLREKKLWRIVSGLEPSPAASATTPTVAESTAIVSPTPAPSVELLTWLEKADQAIGVIGRLMSENLRHHIQQYTEDPAAPWKHLNDTFGQNTAANIGRLRRELTSIKFDSSKSTMADHLARIEQLAHDIGVAERPLTKSEIAVAMLQSMPPDYTVIVQVIQGADKGTYLVYIYNKLVDEEQH